MATASSYAPFYTFDQTIQTPFTNGMAATVNSAMSAIQGPLTALVVLWIIVTGILVLRGDVSVRTGSTPCSRRDGGHLGLWAERRSTRNAVLYVTTFPCHNCTKHIIAAGFQKVFYIEPYAKSKALQLHRDAISFQVSEKNTPPSCEEKKIPFLSFIGIGPRRYLDLFSLTLGTGYKIERKAEGKKILWRRATAPPRLQMQPISYLDREELALNRLEKLILTKRVPDGACQTEKPKTEKPI